MQAETHLYAVIWYSRIEKGIFLVSNKFPRLLDSRNDLDKGNYSHVSQLLDLICLHQEDVTRRLSDNILLVKLPDKQESITNVLIRRPGVRIDDVMHDFSDLVHEDHNILLEDFCRICEITNITESEDTHDLASREDRVDATT